MQIGEVLSRAWAIIWKHKVLWIFGILAGISGVNTTSSFSQSSKGQQFPSQFENYINQLPDWQIALFVLFVILVVVLLVVLLVFLSTMGKIGLIRGTLRRSSSGREQSISAVFLRRSMVRTSVSPGRLDAISARLITVPEEPRVTSIL